MEFQLEKLQAQLQIVRKPNIPMLFLKSDIPSINALQILFGLEQYDLPALSASPHRRPPFQQHVQLNCVDPGLVIISS